MCCGRSTKAKAELQRFKISLQNCNTKLDALIQEEIDDLFGKVDVDGSQALDMSEAKSMVSKLEDRGFEFPCEVGAFDQDGDGNIDKQEATPKVFLYFDISECARFLMLCEQRFGKGQRIWN
eukprot:g19271.t1